MNDFSTHPYLFTLIALAGFGLMGFMFYLIMVQINRRGSAISAMMLTIEDMRKKLDAVAPPKPFMKYAENVFSSILHHDGDTSGMDGLLDQLTRAPEEPMSVADRDKLKGLLGERKMDITRSEKERKVAGMMGDMMDLVLDEAAGKGELSDVQPVGVRVESESEEKEKEKD